MNLIGTAMLTGVHSVWTGGTPVSGDEAKVEFMLKLRSVKSAVAVFLVCCGAALPSQAQSGSGAQTMPGAANALMVVEVAKLLDSPLAKSLGTQSNMIKGYAGKPLAVPASARRVTIGALVNPGNMNSVWEAAIVELMGTPNFDPILRAQGGYLDMIGGKKAAWTPNDVFYVELGQNTMGIVRPGQRQYVTRWLTGKGQPIGSAFLKQAQASATNAHVLFALDLDEVVGLTAIRHAARMGELPTLSKVADTNPNIMAAVASVKGLRLSIQATDKLNADLVVEFDQSVAALGASAKAFVSEVLASLDLHDAILDPWEFKAEGNKIVGKGTMEPAGLNRLLLLLSPAGIGTASSVEMASGTGGAEAPSPSADPKLDAAQASLQYYKTVSGIVDGISKKASPTDSGKWMIAKARVIEQLPILNVDPELLAWGSSVVDALNRAAVELGVGQQKAQVAAKGVASPTAYVTATEYGDGGSNDSPESRAAFRNAEEQRRQVSQAERMAAAEKALNILTGVVSDKNKVRASMVQKYGVEF